MFHFNIIADYHHQQCFAHLIMRGSCFEIMSKIFLGPLKNVKRQKCVKLKNIFSKKFSLKQI
jgi:hypothetical protein